MHPKTAATKLVQIRALHLELPAEEGAELLQLVDEITDELLRLYVAAGEVQAPEEPHSIMM